MSIIFPSQSPFMTTFDGSMIEVVDKMFDCLNVTSCSEGIKKRKPAKDPYYHADDWRLKVINNSIIY